MRKIQFIVGILFMILVAGCSDEHDEHHEHHEENIKFKVTKPVRMDTSITQNYVCQVHSVQHIELRALERGYIEEIFVDEGQSIKKGQLMFRIMPLLYQAEREKAKAEADFAEIEYKNIKVLADSNIVSQNELAMARAKYNKAKAELSLASAHLHFTEIRAPFDGLMDHFHVRVGSLVEEGELLTTLSDNSKIWVYFNVPEAEYLEYMAHIHEDSILEVSLLMANNRVFGHKGQVSTIEADFNNKTGNIAFRATFPNPQRLLRHGETGNIQVKVPLNNAMLIPQMATYEVLDKKYVFVVDENNVVHSRQIVIGEELPHLFVVRSGLKETDRILFEGLRKVKENDVIALEELNAIATLNSLALKAQ